MKRVLILGGTAFFGRLIAEKFQAAGYDVTIFSRREAPPQFKYIRGDRNDPSALEQLSKQKPWDIIIDNIAYNAIHVDSLLKYVKPKDRYFLTSTVSVYRYSPQGWRSPLKEDSVEYSFQPSNTDPDNIHWSYAFGKKEAEKTLTAIQDFPWTIFRPSVVYGPHDPLERGWWYLARLLDGNPIGLGDSGTYNFRIVYSEDLAQAFVDASRTSKTECCVYNLAQPEIITLREFIEQAARVLKLQPDFEAIPMAFLEELAGPFHNLHNLIPDISSAQNDFAFKTTPWERFAQISALWFKDHWKGDRVKLLQTREQEVEFIKRWRDATGRFKSLLKNN